MRTRPPKAKRRRNRVVFGRDLRFRMFRGRLFIGVPSQMLPVITFSDPGPPDVYPGPVKSFPLCVFNGTDRFRGFFETDDWTRHPDPPLALNLNVSAEVPTLETM